MGVVQAAIAPYLMWIRLGILAAVLIGAGALIWRIHAWHAGYIELGHEKACDVGTLCAERAAAQVAETQRKVAEQQAKQSEAATRYEVEIATLNARPVRTVRLCNEANSGVVRDAAVAGAADQASTAAGVLPATPGRDIGPELHQLLVEAESVSAQLRGVLALQPAKPK